MGNMSAISGVRQAYSARISPSSTWYDRRKNYALVFCKFLENYPTHSILGSEARDRNGMISFLM